MSATSETRVAERQILLVGPYGVLGTGVIDAVAENPMWGDHHSCAPTRAGLPSAGRTPSHQRRSLGPRGHRDGRCTYRVTSQAGLNNVRVH
jgi:hypothetical protein